LGAGLGAYWNVAPEPFFAPRFALGWNVHPSLFVELDFAAWPWMVANPENGPTAVDVETYVGTFAVCHKFAWFTGCGLLAGGALHAVGLSPQVNATTTYPFFGVGARGSIERTVLERASGSRLALRADVDGLINIATADLYGWHRAVWNPIVPAAGLTVSVVATF
jgi:hypothetical protein